MTHKARETIHQQQGYALVLVIVMIAMASIIVSGAVSIAIVNTKGSSAQELGSGALSVAEAGVDNAILRLLRDPNYTGETLFVADGSAVITVSGTDTKTITVVANQGSFERRVQVIGRFSNQVFTITSWQEI